MNKKGNFIIIILFSAFMFVYFNRLIDSKYNVNILDFFIQTMPLTSEEKQWLNENQIVFGADNSSPPLRYVDEESGQYIGTSIDIVDALSIELGVEIKLRPSDFEKAFTNLDNGNISMCDIFPSTERAKKYDFSSPVYNLRGVILVPRDNKKVDSYEDLSGLQVAVPNKDYAIEFLEEKKIGAKLVGTSNIMEAIELLQNKQVDAVIGDEPVITFLLKEKNINNLYKVVDKPMYEKDVVLAVRRSDTTLLSIINKGLLNIKKKEVVQNIQQKWFGISAPISHERITYNTMLYLGAALMMAYLVIYAMYYWNRKLDEEVKKQTEELFNSRNDLQTIFDGLTYLMVAVDLNFKVISANRAFCEFWSIKKDEVIGTECSKYKELICPNYEENFIIQEILSSNTGRKYDVKYNERYFDIDTFPIEDMKKNLIKVLFVIKDVTELRVAQKQLLQADKMVAVGQLTAGIGHEIRNPLGLIRNYTYLLKNQLENHNDITKKCIHVIESSVDRASNIIENLLNFSRESARKKEQIDIREFSKEIIELENKIIENNNISVEEEYEQNSDIYANSESLKHILINLLSNAVDAMPNGGLLKIKCFTHNYKLIIEISDTGMGIRKEDVDNIFNPFFTTKEPGKGTGLGLYVVYNEVEKNGGEIKVSSEYGKGSTFKVEIPILDNEI